MDCEELEKIEIKDHKCTAKTSSAWNVEHDGGTFRSDIRL